MPKGPYAKYGATTIVAPAQTARQHVVRGGETIQSIACLEYPTEGYSAEAWRQLAEANDIDDLDSLTTGQVLTVPSIQSTT